MAQTPVYRFQVNVLQKEEITPSVIAQSPRVYKPQELVAACANIDLVSAQADCPAFVLSFVRYVLTDFFVQLHRTGLYNRQLQLWQSLSKVTAVKAEQLTEGLLSKAVRPAHDVHFLGGRQRELVYARVVHDTHGGGDERYLNDFVKRAQKISPNLCGLLFAWVGAMPARVSSRVAKWTDAHDAVGRYEAILKPHGVALDLIEIGADGCELVHPDLKIKKRT